MTSDARTPTTKDPNPTNKAPTDPPIYSEASTPEEIEKSQKEEK
jgi:hypothetical protein